MQNTMFIKRKSTAHIVRQINVSKKLKNASIFFQRLQGAILNSDPVVGKFKDSLQ